MANRDDKVALNVEGAVFVDTNCIDCDLCRQTAPNHFDRSEEGGYSFVCKQPETAEEKALCHEAMEECPVEAIGDDG